MTSIELLAARYLDDLRAFQPDGPYFLGGFCVGGMVAFELARQLRAQGQEVALLALIESPSPIGLRFEHRPAVYFRRRRAEIFERARTLSLLSDPPHVRALAELLKPYLELPSRRSSSPS